MGRHLMPSLLLLAAGVSLCAGNLWDDDLMASVDHAQDLMMYKRGYPADRAKRMGWNPWKRQPIYATEDDDDDITERGVWTNRLSKRPPPRYYRSEPSVNLLSLIAELRRRGALSRSSPQRGASQTAEDNNSRNSLSIGNDMRLLHNILTRKTTHRERPLTASVNRLIRIG